MNESSEKMGHWIRRLAVKVGILGVGLALLTWPSFASAAAEWQVETFVGPERLAPGGGASVVRIEIGNKGDAAASLGTYSAEVDLPEGVTFQSMSGDFVCFGSDPLNCIGAANLSAKARSGFQIIVAAEPGAAQGPRTIEVSVSGGGAVGTAVVEHDIEVTSELSPFGIRDLVAGAFDHGGADFTDAGRFPPQAFASFKPNLDAVIDVGSGLTQFTYAEDMAKDIVVDLPSGFLGNPMAAPRCTAAQFALNQCPVETQIGITQLMTNLLGATGSQVFPIYNLVPPHNRPAEFGFKTDTFDIKVKPEIRSDGDYGVTMHVNSLPEADAILRSKTIIWGVPAEPANDIERCKVPNPVTRTCLDPQSSSAPRKPFLINPTNCADRPSTTVRLSRYEDPADLRDPLDPRWSKYTVQHPPVTSCDAVPFAPTIEFETSEGRADTPTGLKAHLRIPQDGVEDTAGYATAHLKRTSVTLPEGVAFNASAADGLEACSPEQIGLLTAPGQAPYRFNNAEVSCPTASKVANAVVTTPLLERKLRGEVFLATQDRNPFDSTFAIYMVVREPSILVKLPGLVELDSATGQIRTVFDENPQLPFSDLELEFFGGPRASLATSQTCGRSRVRSEFVPWSAEDPDSPKPHEVVVEDDSLAVTQGAGGAGCVTTKGQLPFELGFTAGVTDPLAGASSKFLMRLTRPDGAQEIDRLELTMPDGFSGILRGIPYCSEAQIAAASANSGRAEDSSSSCPAGSRLGSTTVGAGAGANPFHVQGDVYLAGPYRGAPLSLVAVVPAVAGPYDLGVQVVRAALRVNPRTAQITAITDPLPRMLEGVPLRLRDIRVSIDRVGFAINPTDCSPQQVRAGVSAVDGANANLSTHFQVAGCGRLGFKPKLSLRLKGGTRRGDHPALRAFLKARPGDANLARAAVTLPPSAFLEQAHIRTVCTRVQFAADQCPAAAIYGFAKATSPLLDDPLQGPVYLRSSDNKLPDLVADLNGQVRIELVGRVDSVRAKGGAGIRNTFEVVPDAPVDTFELRMQGGKKGLVVNSRNLCTSTQRATVRLAAQNGRRYNFRPKVVAKGCKRATKRKSRRR